MVILFLDFDGVLHPEVATTERLFCHVDRLDQVLSDYPDVQIVVSSSWRESHEMAEILVLLGSLSRRVIGATPVRPDRSQLPERLWSFVREGECVAWLRAHGHLSTPWLALDDHPWRFNPMCPNLMLISRHTGLSETDAANLRVRLHKLLEEAR